MTRNFVSPRGLRAFGLSALVALLPLPGCTHDLLQVTDPDIIPDVNTPSGALALKNGVIFRLEQVTAALGGTVTYGDPVSDDSMFALAVATADSALANRAGADSVRVRQLASIVKARALLNRGQFAAAAAAVADDVTTRFHYDATYSANAGQNEIGNLNTSIKRYSMGDREGGTGLPFASALDPRIPRRIGGRVFDSATPLTAIVQ